MLVMVVGMMIQRAVDDGFVEEQDEDQDFFLVPNFSLRNVFATNEAICVY